MLDQLEEFFLALDAFEDLGKEVPGFPLLESTLHDLDGIPFDQAGYLPNRSGVSGVSAPGFFPDLEDFVLGFAS